MMVENKSNRRDRVITFCQKRREEVPNIYHRTIKLAGVAPGLFFFAARLLMSNLKRNANYNLFRRFIGRMKCNADGCSRLLILASLVMLRAHAHRVSTK